MVIDSDAGEIMATVVKVKGSKAVIKAESLGFEKGDDVSLSSGGSSSMSGGSGLSDMELTGSLGMNFGLEGTTPFVIAGDFKTKMGFAPNILFRGGLSFWSSETDVLFVKVNFTSILVHFGAEYLINMDKIRFGLGGTLGYELLTVTTETGSIFGLPGTSTEEDGSGIMLSPLATASYQINDKFAVGAEFRFGLRFARDEGFDEDSDISVLASFTYFL